MDWLIKDNQVTGFLSALQAYVWSAVSALDYLETGLALDVKYVGIKGVSRYGKATLCFLVFEDRFAIGLSVIWQGRCQSAWSGARRSSGTFYRR